MAKKKEKKKGKGKGKKKQKQDELSNIEREILLLTIEELGHKIAWREHLCSIISEDIKVYLNEMQIQNEDKYDSVNLLEKAIEEQQELSGEMEKYLPDAENLKTQAEERRSRELAAKLLQINREKQVYDQQLKVLRGKLEILDNYNTERVEEKIKQIEKQLDSEESEETLRKVEEQSKRRQATFKKEMQDILVNEAQSFQDEIRGKLDTKFERITEETRWWADTVSGLRIASERLEAINDDTLSKLKASQEDLKMRKERSLKEGRDLQEGEATISELVHRNKEMEDKRKSDAEFRNYLSHLNSMSESLKQNYVEQENTLMASFYKIKENEDEINLLEDNLAAEISFGSQLAKFIEKAQQIVTEEAKYSLIVTHDGPLKEKNTIGELRCLFEAATRFIYERENKTLL